MCRVKRIVVSGSDKGQFNNPRQLMTAHQDNNRICVHDPDLNHLRSITHLNMSLPSDVKVSRNRLYVLCPNDNPCMHVLEGDMLHSLITCGDGLDVLWPYFFCLDAFNNFVISDFQSHSIRVFSPEGNLLHKIRREGHQPGMFCLSTGVAVTPKGRLVCVLLNVTYGLQIFY